MYVVCVYDVDDMLYGVLWQWWDLFCMIDSEICCVLSLVCCQCRIWYGVFDFCIDFMDVFQIVCVCLCVVNKVSGQMFV